MYQCRSRYISRSVGEDEASILTNEVIPLISSMTNGKLVLRAVSLLTQQEPRKAFLPRQFHPVIMKYSHNFALGKVLLLKGVIAAMTSLHVASWNMVEPPSRVSSLRTSGMLHAAVPQTLFDGVFGVFTISPHYSAEQYNQWCQLNPCQWGHPTFRSADGRRSRPRCHGSNKCLNATWKQSTFSPTRVLATFSLYSIEGALSYLMGIRRSAALHTEHIRK